MHAAVAIALIAQSAFAADTLRTPGGPEVVRSPAPGPLVALRLAVPLPSDLPVGSAELLQELARPAAEEAARRVGAALELGTTADEATIALTGSAAAFDALVAILRRATAEPDLAVASLRSARARAEDRVLAALERPVPRLRTLLAARLDGRVPAGPALDDLDPETLRSLAARLHAPSRLRVLLVGDLPREVVRSAFSAWPRSPASAPPAHTARSPHAPLPSAQAHHAWVGLGFALDAEPGALAVAAELVARRLRVAGLREGAAEAWFRDRAGVLVLLAGAAPDDPAVAGAARITAFPDADGAAVPPLARFLRRMIAEAAALASPAAVDGAAAGLRRAMLLEARTVSGRAALLGRWAGGPGTGGGALAVHDVLSSLRGVTYDEVRRVLDRALAGAPVLVEVRP